jgi:hypothetical protein
MGSWRKYIFSRNIVYSITIIHKQGSWTVILEDLALSGSLFFKSVNLNVYMQLKHLVNKL